MENFRSMNPADSRFCGVHDEWKHNGGANTCQTVYCLQQAFKPRTRIQATAIQSKPVNCGQPNGLKSSLASPLAIVSMSGSKPLP